MIDDLARNARLSNQTSTRRELVVYNDQPGEDGKPAYMGLWVDGVQVAAAVAQDEYYAERNNGARWSLWSSGLALRMSSDAPVALGLGHPEPTTARPLPVRDEHDARAWLALLGDLAEHGARSAETRRMAGTR